MVSQEEPPQRVPGLSDVDFGPFDWLVGCGKEVNWKGSATFGVITWLGSTPGDRL